MLSQKSMAQFTFWMAVTVGIGGVWVVSSLTPGSTTDSNEPNLAVPMVQSALLHSYGGAPRIEDAMPPTKNSTEFAVVRGIVLGVSSPKWNTPDGEKPMGHGPGGLGTGGYLIYRVAQVRVDEVLVGAAVSGTVEVSLLGGHLDGIMLDVSEFGTQPEDGASVVLFLAQGEVVGSFVPGTWSPLLTYIVKDGWATNSRHGSVPEAQLVARIRAIADER